MAYQGVHMASAGGGEDASGADVESYPLHVDYCGGECLTSGHLHFSGTEAKC